MIEVNRETNSISNGSNGCKFVTTRVNDQQIIRIKATMGGASCNIYIKDLTGTKGLGVVNSYSM